MKVCNVYAVMLGVSIICVLSFMILEPKHLIIHNLRQWTKNSSHRSEAIGVKFNKIIAQTTRVTTISSRPMSVPGNHKENQTVTLTHEAVVSDPNVSLSHFIYVEPTDIKFYSMHYGSCTGCTNGCLNATEVPANNCISDKCLCFKRNPKYFYVKFSDNSIRADDFMLEDERQTLFDARITDVKRLPDISKTELTVLTRDYNVSIGDVITVRIKLIDGFGKYLNRGGDDVRVWMLEKVKNIRIAGRHHDYNNGTYLVTVPARWNGSYSIFVSIPFFREELAMKFRWNRQFKQMVCYDGVFQTKMLTQKTLCNFRPNIPGYRKYCDLSVFNAGDPFFCGKPPSDKLTCEDFQEARTSGVIDVGVTQAEHMYSARKCSNVTRMLKEVQVNITVKDEGHPRLPKCKDLPVSQTWNTTDPTGYYFKDSYYSTKCEVTKINVSTCLHNTTLVLTGDSTLRQFFSYVQRHARCIITTRAVKSKKWYYPSHCIVDKWNFKMKFYFHTTPNMGIWRSWSHETKSIATLLDEIPKHGRFIFVFHLFAHFNPFHYNVFRDLLRSSLPSLRKALARNDELRVAIKGPHVYYCTSSFLNFNDFHNIHFITILKREMKEFSNRVVFIDYRDMMIASQNKYVHPPPPQVAQSVDWMFQHIC